LELVLAAEQQRLDAELVLQAAELADAELASREPELVLPGERSASAQLPR
jgi:hypothetical protein